MANILLVDSDSKIPNRALINLYTYFKKLGHNVGFNINNPDVIYASVVFTKNKHKVDGLKFFYPDAEIIIGGSGYDLTKKLPEEIEFVKPDYSLYPDMDYSIGFTTRGCIRNCDFCIVPKKEGKYKIWQHPEEFHYDKFEKILLLDNNIYANKEWFFEVTNWIIERNLETDINQGMDIRILDDEIAEQLSKIKFKSHTMKFAWDNIDDEKYVKRGIEILKNADINTRQDVKFYVLVNYNSTHEEDLYRCEKLKEWKVNPFVMQYDGGDYFTNKLSRWANRVQLLWSIDFIDYDGIDLKTKYEISQFSYK